MDKLNYNMMQLLNEFKSSSKEKGKEGDANVVKAQPSSFAKRWRKAQEEQEKKGSKEKKPKGKWFHCGVDEHWKRKCNKYLEDLREKK